MQIHRYLDLDVENLVIRCRECGYEFGPAEENYKQYAAMRTAPVTDAGPGFDPPEKILESGDPGLEFRQFFCPDCAVLLDHEFAREDDPILHDIEIDVESLRGDSA